MTELEAIAEAVCLTAAHLKQHIEDRAREIAAPVIANAEQSAKRQVNEARAEHWADQQRWADLEREFRWQAEAFAKQINRLSREAGTGGPLIDMPDPDKVWGPGRPRYDAEQSVIGAAKVWQTWLADDPDLDKAERDLAAAVADLARVESGDVQDGEQP